ncbi:PAS domain-containing protein [uncultured Tenacibaculum sp.]|uniref:PAS domain-containing protein n=1 Tax=uncultured Tenacibaculum sp. TaxID=174713 RepID=UPI00262BF1CD|nr:PAS domain-containing protein [uncultured Tenacibaculum sp.]
MIKDYRVIGIGTSAGGLEVLKTFFNNVPEDFNHVFIIIQHLSPDYKSLMAELLVKNTSLPIQEVESGVKIQPGNIYLLPPKKNMTIEGDSLILTDRPEKNILNLPIDIFFKSLAVEQKEQAIAIILSGTGSDGTRGIRKIKEFGGMVIVQDPEEAKFDGMPKNAIGSGFVDAILPISEIPAELISFIEHANAIEEEKDKDSILSDDILKGILRLVHNKTGIDFSEYKRPTLNRRITRRMSVTKTKTVGEYLNYLHEHDYEAEILHKEFLIGVTKFFRDKEAFTFINDEVIPKIFESKENNEPVKVWSVGCSSGEEAYSLAILLNEYKEKHNIKRDIKIFGTDLDADAINKANRGVFSESIVGDVCPDLLEKYFQKEGDSYVISPKIRQSIIFSLHNTAQDPPFNNMDLTICRNLLIYLQPNLQQKLLSDLHYATGFNKFLFLGPSETLGELSKSFNVLSRKWNIYQNIKAYTGSDFSPRIYKKSNIDSTKKTYNQNKQRTIDQKLSESLSGLLLEEFSASSICIDNNYELVSADGNFKEFIELPENKFRSFDILKMLPKELSLALSTALVSVEQKNEKVRYDNITFEKDDKKNVVSILVSPVESLSNYRKLYLIIFKKEQTYCNIESHGADTDNFNYNKISSLEEELRDTKINLQSKVDEIEVSNEELQSANEELLASNEELQTTNEELQSVNEELHTVNAEYQDKILELVQLNDDLENLILSVDIGVLFLDENLIIRRFSPSLKKFINIDNSDVGRSIVKFKTNLKEEHQNCLLQSITKVINTGKIHEQEVQLLNDSWYLKRINPFLSEQNKIKGVVVSFVDINTQKNTELELLNKGKFLTELTSLLPGLIYVYNHETNMNEYANRDIASVLGYTKEEVKEFGDTFLVDIVHPDDIEKVFGNLQKIQTSADNITHDIEYRVRHKNGNYIWLLSKETIFERLPSGKMKIIGVATDITHVKNTENELLEKSNFLSKITDVMPGITYIYNQETQENEYVNQEIAKVLGYSKSDIETLGSDLMTEIIHPNDMIRMEKHHRAISESKDNEILDFEYRAKHKDGKYRWFLSKETIFEKIKGSDKVKHIGVGTDITNLKEVEHKLNESNIMYNIILETTLAGYWDWRVKENYTYYSASFKAMFGFEDHEVPNSPDWWAQQMHPDDVKQAYDIVEEHIKSKGKIPFTNEARYFHKNGSIVWVYCNGKVIEWDENGEPLRVIGSHVEITKIKEAEQKLFESNIMYNNIIEATLAGYWDWYIQEDKVFYSPTFKSMFGFEDHEVPNEPSWWQQQIHPDDLGRVLQSAEDHIATKGEVPFLNEVRYYHKDGSIVWVRCKGRVIEWDENGEAVRLVGSHVEITNIKEAERKLSETNKMYTSIIEGNLVGYWDWHVKENYEYYSPAFKAMFGFTEGEVSNSPDWWKQQMHPEDIPEVLSLFNEHIKSKGKIPYAKEVRYYHKDGSLMWIYFTGNVIEWNDNDEPLRVVGSHIDITKIKEAEETFKLNNAYHNILEESLAGYWDWYIQEDYEYMSPRLKNMLGFEDHEVPNKPDWWQKQIHPDDLSGVLEIFEKHVSSKGEIPYDNEVRYYHKNGSIVWVYCRGKVIEWGNNGEPIRMVGSHIDITPLKNK